MKDMKAGQPTATHQQKTNGVVCQPGAQSTRQNHTDRNHLLRRQKEKPSLGQRLSDATTAAVGSWYFIGAIVVFVVVWAVLNSYLLLFGILDPYPFILLNLSLSALAAIQAPIILMSTNRAAEHDRKRAEADYYINRKAEREIKVSRLHLLEMKELLMKQPLTDDIRKLNEDIRRIQEELNKLSSRNVP